MAHPEIMIITNWNPSASNSGKTGTHGSEEGKLRQLNTDSMGSLYPSFPSRQHTYSSLLFPEGLQLKTHRSD